MSATATAPTSPTAARKEGSCPYAVALHRPGTHSDSSTKDSHANSGCISGDESSSSSSSSSLLDDISQCPAFSQSCPFKSAKTASEIRQTLLQVPASHYSNSPFVKNAINEKNNNGNNNNTNNAFVQVLRELHTQAGHGHQNVMSQAFQMPTGGSCPVSGILHLQNVLTFSDALENCSLAAIMARMMEEEGSHSQEEQQQPITESVQSPGNLEPIVKKKDSLELSSGAAVASSSSSTAATAAATVTTTDAKQRMPQHRTSLSESLKKGTATAHQAAENVHFVKNFIQGRIDRRLYAQLVVRLYHVYAQLEASLDSKAAATFGACHFPELYRTPALEQDMDFWHGSLWGTGAGTGCVISPATQDYLERLQHLQEHDPLLLLAHAYTRYLGDLSGGKILARVAKRALNLQADIDAADAVDTTNSDGDLKKKKKASTPGLDFYDFGDKIGSAKLFKDKYRKALDNLEFLTPKQINKLVAEANLAFYLNMRLFQELDVMANIPDARVQPMEEVYTELARMMKDHEQEDAANQKADQECPFLKQSKEKQQVDTISSGKGNGNGQCPWPFVLMHDPVEGMKNWKTWVIVGLMLMYAWKHMAVLLFSN